MRFLPDVVQYVEEHQWHPSQRLSRQRDGSVIAEFRLSSLEELKSWVQSFGAQAVVLEPDELREAMIKELQTALSVYEVEKRK